MRERIPRFATLFALLLTLVVAALVAGCGGSDGDGGESADGDTDAQTILSRALGAGESIDSGVLDLELSVDATADENGSIDASIVGPFQSSGDGKLPQLDFDGQATISAAGTDSDFEGGITLTADNGYVSYAGQAYELDPGTFELLQSSYEQSSELQDEQGEGNSLAQFGIDPAEWVTELTNEGTEDLDGTEVVHVSGAADVAKLVADLTSVTEQTGQAAQVDTAALAQLEDSVKNATVDVYASADDSTLRKFTLSIDFVDPTATPEATTSVELSIGIADPGEDQSIEAPADAQPIAGLLQQFPTGAQALQGLGGIGGGADVPPATPDTSSGGGAASGSGSSDAADAYFDCASNAATPEEVDACADLLGG